MLSKIKLSSAIRYSFFLFFSSAACCSTDRPKTATVVAYHFVMGFIHDFHMLHFRRVVILNHKHEHFAKLLVRTRHWRFSHFTTNLYWGELLLDLNLINATVIKLLLLKERQRQGASIGFSASRAGSLSFAVIRIRLHAPGSHDAQMLSKARSLS